jgi:hypothetical protein
VTSASGGALTKLASQAAVAQSSTSAWAIVGGHAYVRLVGAGTVTIR